MLHSQLVELGQLLRGRRDIRAKKVIVIEYNKVTPKIKNQMITEEKKGNRKKSKPGSHGEAWQKHEQKDLAWVSTQ